jgi:hypothetical protein
MQEDLQKYNDSLKYSDLQSLIFQNGNARQYYNELPRQLREGLDPHSDEIHTYESLREHVENLKGVNENDSMS